MDAAKCHLLRSNKATLSIPALVRGVSMGQRLPMLSLPVYHYLHLIGLILVFVGIGGLLSSEGAKKAMMWHGIGLVISFISGFAMLSKMGFMSPMPKWVMIKIALWLVLGFLPVLAKRRVVTASVVVMLAVIVGAALAALGYFKPQF
jgi:hypothetical protein